MSSPHTAQRWTIRAYGDIDNLTKETVQLPDPSEGQLLVSVRAIGLNFADIFSCLGLYPPAGDPPLTPGFEVSGTIAAVGPGVLNFQVGDRVLGLLRSGGYATAVCLDHRYVYPLPSDWTFNQGAAWAFQALTAWYSLCVLGAISKRYVHPLTSAKKRVLVHSAAGGVGLNVVRLVHKLGGEVVATIGNPSKTNVLQQHGVNPNNIIVRGIDDKASGFEKTVRQRIGEHDEVQGVDVVIDPVMGPYFNPGWNLLNRGGRYIAFGSAHMMPSTGLSLSNIVSIFKLAWKYITRPKLDLLNTMSDNKSVAGFNAGLLIDHVGFIKTGYAELMDIGQDAPFVSKVYPFGEAKQALKDFQSGRTVGKLILITES